MNSINFRDKFLELFPEDYKKVLPTNAEWCFHCGGIGWHNKVKGFVTYCNVCNGRGYIETKICECGKEITYRGDTKCSDCKGNEFKKAQKEKELVLYNKAGKVKFINYDGMFWDGDWDCIKDSGDFEEWLSDLIYSGEDYPSWIWGTEKQLAISIDICDVVNNACEDGYEDMYDSLDTNSLQPIQEQIDDWITKQGDSAYVYSEDYKTVVELDDLINEIKEQMKADLERPKYEKESKYCQCCFEVKIKDGLTMCDDCIKACQE